MAVWLLLTKRLFVLRGVFHRLRHSRPPLLFLFLHALLVHKVVPCRLQLLRGCCLSHVSATCTPSSVTALVSLVRACVPPSNTHTTRNFCISVRVSSRVALVARLALTDYILLKKKDDESIQVVAGAEGVNLDVGIAADLQICVLLWLEHLRQ